MSEPNRDDLSDKAHLYRGLSHHPSAHDDPPASAAGPAGLRQEPGNPSGGGTAPSMRTIRTGSIYGPAAPRLKRGGGLKLMLGTAAVIGAALAYFFLPKFGFGPGSNPPGGGPPANPPGSVQVTQPGTMATPAASGPTVDVTGSPLHLTIQDEIYHIGPATGREVALDEVVELAKKSDHPGSPVHVDLNGSSRAGAEERLKSAFDQQHIPVIWTENGKPLTGELPTPGKVPGP